MPVHKMLSLKNINFYQQSQVSNRIQLYSFYNPNPLSKDFDST